MKLKKLLPAFAIAGVSASVFPAVVSCGQEKVTVTIEDSEKSKQCVVLGREKSGIVQKKTATGIWNFKLDGKLEPKTQFEIVDVTNKSSDVIEDLTFNNFQCYTVVDTLTIEVTFVAKKNKVIQEQDKFEFGFGIKSKNNQISLTKFDGLTLEMVPVPCDINGGTVVGSPLIGKQKDGETAVMVSGIEIDNGNFEGTIAFVNNIAIESDPMLNSSNYTISVDSGTIMNHAAGSKAITFVAETNTPIEGEDPVSFTATSTELPSISVYFVPTNTKICPYISTMNIPSGQNISINVSKQV